jgi:hypothetical protein
MYRDYERLRKKKKKELYWMVFLQPIMTCLTVYTQPEHVLVDIVLQLVSRMFQSRIIQAIGEMNAEDQEKVIEYIEYTLVALTNAPPPQATPPRDKPMACEPVPCEPVACEPVACEPVACKRKACKRKAYEDPCPFMGDPLFLNATTKHGYSWSNVHTGPPTIESDNATSRTGTEKPEEDQPPSAPSTDGDIYTVVFSIFSVVTAVITETIKKNAPK